MSEKLTCPICGEPTRVYMGHTRKDHLCGKHADELKAGKLEQCPDCNAWHYTDKHCKCKNKKTKKDETCIICGKTTKDGWQYLCSDCYSKCLDFTKEMNKNYTIHEHREYYYNLKSNIYRLTGFKNYIIPNCIKLVAIAKACDRYANSSILLEIVKDDIKEIVKKKKDKDIIPENKEKEIVSFNTKKNQGLIRGIDGHFLDSDKEKTIDDLLYNNEFVHAIHFNVPEITERTVNCDWYIPVTPKKGIHIEYLGMDKNDCIENNQEKIELYEKHNLKFITIQYEDTLDTQRLAYNLTQEIEKLKKEIYNSN